MENINQSIKLKGAENWPVWRFQTQVMLKGRGYMEIVTGENKCPEKTEDAVPPKPYTEWIKADAKAQELIVTRMEEEPVSYLFSCNSSHEMWSKLQSVYDKESTVSVHLLQQRFFGMQIEEGESISKYFQRVEEIRIKLKVAGEPISENMVITKILMTLPEPFKHFRSAWESVPSEKQTLKDLISRLLLEEERTSSNEETVALAASSSPQVSNKIVKCFNCGEVGHYAKFCKRKDTRQCFNCKRNGHISSQCRVKGGKTIKSKTRVVESNAFMMSSKRTENNVWYMDTGASEHMCGKRDLFKTCILIKNDSKVKVGNGDLLQVRGVGTVELFAWNGEKYLKTELTNVLYVPDLKFNLFSAGYVLDKGLYLTSNNLECRFVNRNEEIRAIGIRENKLYKMLFVENQFQGLVSSDMAEKNVSNFDVFSCNLGKKIEKLSEWHMRFAHQSFAHVRSFLIKNKITFQDDSEFFVCEKCLAGKQHRISFPVSKSRAKERLELIHADLCGPMEQESLGGARYFLLLKDDYSAFRVVYFLRHKSNARKQIENYVRRAENETGCKIKVFRSDNGLEFINKELTEFFESRGIKHQKSVVYTPQQNGRAEREMRTIVESARAAITGLHKRFWAEAVNSTVYTLNRTSKSPISEITPFEAYFKEKPKFENLQEFGIRVSAHIPKQRRKKLDSKNRFGILVGYSEDTKAYRIFFSETNKIEILCDVIFLPQRERNKIEALKNEDSVVDTLQILEEESEIEDILENSSVNSERDGENEEIHEPKEIEEVVEIGEEFGETEGDEEIEQDGKSSSSTYSLRARENIKLSSKYDDYHVSLICEENPTYEQVIASSERKSWRKAMDNELEALKENNTWKIVSKPLNCRPIDCKWVFRQKSSNQEVVYKARLVARGFLQFELSEAYSPVARLPSIRAFLGFCNERKLLVHQLDVCSAFLHGDVTGDVFISLPKGCEQIEVKEGRVLKLQKSLYGLKDSPKNWNMKFTATMRELGFHQSKFEYCLFYKNEHKCRTFIMLYVDDLLLASTEEKNVLQTKIKLKEHFKMKDLGKVNMFLGMHVVQDLEENTIALSQKFYLEKLLKKFNMFDCNAAKTPMQENFDHSNLKREASESDEVEKRCRMVIGSLMYAMLCTRPDLCLSISVLSRYQSCASMDLWNALKYVLRYVKGSLDLKLVFRKNEAQSEIIGYVDSDWAGDKVDRKSTGGFIFKIFNCAVSWGSRKQATVALSSTESEFIALSSAVSEACWLRSLFKDLQGSEVRVTLYEDNQSVIKLCKNPQFHHKLKHIDIKVHFIRDKIKSNILTVLYVNTNDQVADVLTKPLGRIKFLALRKELGLL